MAAAAADESSICRNVCIVCRGTATIGSISGRAIDFSNNFLESAFHYAVCYFDVGAANRANGGADSLRAAIPAIGAVSWSPDGHRPLDDANNELFYACPYCPYGSTEDEEDRLSYKHYFVHVAVLHHRLGDVLLRDQVHSGVQCTLTAYVHALMCRYGCEAA